LRHIILSFLLLTLAFANIPRHAGAIAGGKRGAEIGYAVALSAEANNRQLHQKEIKWIERHAGEFARELYGDSLTPEQTAEAEARLAQQALRQVDKAWSLKLGSKTDQKAQAFLQKNNAKLFTVKDKHEFMDGSTDGEREISSYSQEEFDRLNSFYQSYVHRPTATNPEGSLRNANQAWANEKGILDALNEGGFDPNQAIRDFIPDTVDAIEDIPDTLNGAGNYVDAVLPTKNQERLDTLYGSHTDGSVLQANMATGDAISTAGMVTGVGGAARGATKSAIRGVDDALDIKVNPLDGTEKSLSEVRSSVSTAKDSYQSSTPKNLEEQLTIKEIQADPNIGKAIGKMGSLNTDPLFHKNDGFQKKSYLHKLNNGNKIEVHYQHDTTTNNVYDIKIVDSKKGKK